MGNANVRIQDLQSELRGAGFVEVGQTGSHERWRAPDNAETITLVIHGREASPKNCFNVRKAIERARERAEARKTDEEALKNDLQGLRASFAESGLETGVAKILTEEGGQVEEAVIVDLRPGDEVSVIDVEKRGRTSRILGSPTLARANVFHLVQESEWRSGLWPSVLERPRRSRPEALVVRRRRLDGDGNPKIDVMWLDLGNTFVSQPGKVAVELKLIYTGAPVARPQDEDLGDGFRLVFSREEGGLWVTGGTYAFHWSLLFGKTTVLWDGWLDQESAVERASEVVIATLEAQGTVEEELPPEPVPSSDPVVDEPVENIVKNQPSIPAAFPAVAFPPELIQRFEALVKALDTPEVRAVTGRRVTFDEVTRIVLTRGLQALEEDLGSRKS